jgi:hypothetical protein
VLARRIARFTAAKGTDPPGFDRVTSFAFSPRRISSLGNQESRVRAADSEGVFAEVEKKCPSPMRIHLTGRGLDFERAAVELRRRLRHREKHKCRKTDSHAGRNRNSTFRQGNHQKRPAGMGSPTSPR